MGIAGRAIAAVAEQAQRRVPAADLDERDPDYIRDTLPRLWMAASLAGMVTAVLTAFAARA